MARLVLRNVDRSIVEALKMRALRHRRSAEAEHRAILETVLQRTRRRTFAEALAAIPNIGLDKDFARTCDPGSKDVFATKTVAESGRDNNR